MILQILESKLLRKKRKRKKIVDYGKKDNLTAA